MAFFSVFQNGFESCQSTADFLTVVPDRIARAFNKFGATQAVAIDIYKGFDRVWHAGLLHKLKTYGISGQIIGLISSFLSNRRFRVVLDRKSSQEYPVNARVPQGSILGPTLFLLCILLPEMHAIKSTCADTHASSFMCAIYLIRGIIVFPLLVLLLL